MEELYEIAELYVAVELYGMKEGWGGSQKLLAKGSNQTTKVPPTVWL